MLTISELFLEYSTLLLIVLALGFCIYMVLSLGGGALNVLFVPLIFGILFFGASKFFIYLNDNGYYNLSETTFHIWWHLLYYLSLLSFIWGGRRIKNISRGGKPIGFSLKDLVLAYFLVLAAASVFLLATPLESVMVPLFDNTIIDRLGLHHVGAVILGFVAAWYIYHIKGSWGQMLSVGVTPMLIFLALLGVQHFWELLTESWKIIILKPEAIEEVEKWTVLVALIFLNIGLVRIIKAKAS